MVTQEKQVVLAKSLAPEDIRAGLYVAVLNITREFIPLWAIFDANTTRPPEMLRVRMLPEDAGAPLKVLDVCLPYVLVETMKGKRQRLDVRSVSLARVSERYAKLARGKPKRKKRKKGKKKAKARS